MAIQIPLLTKTPISGFTIRKAEKKDAKLLLSFIKQLAEYEKMSNDVVADDETLSSFLFCENPFAHVVIGEYNSQPVGFALFFTNFSTFLGRPGIFLEDLFVNPEFRGKGFGKSILMFLAKIAVDNNFGRVEWTVLNWNESAINFYKKLGAVPMTEWTIFRLTGSELEKIGKQF
ncbi:MAG: N-acetyltransferase family protein [Tenuifilaceae bacterium]